MYALYELKIVFSKQTTCYIEFYQHHLLLKCLCFLTTYVVNGCKIRDIKTNWQKSFPYEMSIREGIVGYFRFRATVQCPLVLETFWTGNRAIFPPSVFRCAHSEKSWIFFSVTTV